MTKLKTLGISLTVATALSFSGCGSSSSDDTTQTPNGVDKSFNSTTFLEDVDGVLSTQTTTIARVKTFMKTFSVIPQAYAGDINLNNFKSFWDDNIATTDNSDSLMGFIRQNVKLVLNGLASSTWDYTKTGSGTMSLTMDNGTNNIPYYSEPITVANGKGAKIYFGVSSKEDYENINYKSSIAMSSGEHTILTLKEVDNVKTFYWVSMEEYTDRDSSEWIIETLSGKEYVKFKRESDDSYKYFPNVNRNKDGASGGRTVLFIVDENKKEIYFEHLTSTEKHNRQEHYTIKITNLEDDNGRLRISSNSKINFSRVARQYFNTDIDGQSVDLVNDSNNSKVIYDILQGSIISGLKYAHSENGIFDNGNSCIKFNDDLDVNNISLSSNCTETISSLPTLTSNFETYKTNPTSNIYLPATGSTYDTIDLRVNMHSIYNDNYDGSWMSKLNVD